MKLRKFLLPLLAALSGLAASAFAQTQTTLATIAKVQGAATVTLADGTVSVLTVGMKVPQGATLTTGPDGDVFLESHPGYVTAIKPGSTVLLEEISVTTTGGRVTEEKTLLDLKNGDVVAILDPKKKSVNNYQVRTAAGVAQANGTVFTVQFKGGTYTIAVVNGQVSITPPGGGTRTPMEAGMMISANESSSGYTLDSAQTMASFGLAGTASAIAGEAANLQNQMNELSELMAVVVATVAVAAQNGIGGTTAAEAAQVAGAVFASVPGAAAQAAALITQSTPAGQDNSAVVAAIAAVVPAAQQAAFSASISSGTFQQTNVNVTTVAAETTTVTPPTSIDSVTISRSN